MAKDPNIDEQFSVDGMSVRRVGKSIQWSLNRSPEEFARFKQETWKARPGLVEQIRASVEDLSGLIQKYSSFELVANLWLKHGVFDPETEVQAMLALREAYPSIRLTLDPNGCWDIPTSIWVLNQLKTPVRYSGVRHSICPLMTSSSAAFSRILAAILEAKNTAS